MRDFIQREIVETTRVLQAIVKNEELLAQLEQISRQCQKSLVAGHKIMFAGNGGSAADSQHLATELVSRLRYERMGLAAIALTTDSSLLTAIANDYSFEHIFARQIEALGQAGDVFIGISTSGRSPNIIKALEKARDKNVITVGLTGQRENNMEQYCDFILKVPSQDTQKIQECHIVLGHLICGLVEEQICGQRLQAQV